MIILFIIKKFKNFKTILKFTPEIVLKFSLFFNNKKYNINKLLR